MRFLNRKFFRTALILGGCFFCLTFNALAADKVARWTGAVDNAWTTPGNWNVYDSGNPQPGNPLNLYPNNGNGGFTYDVVIPNGSSQTLNTNATIKGFSLSGGNLSGSGQLVVENVADLVAGNVYLFQLNTTGQVNVTGIVNFWAGANWNNSGSVNFTAGVLGFSNANTALNNLPGAVFNILTPDLASNGVAIGGGGGVVNNQGTFIVNTPGNSGIGVTFNNAATGKVTVHANIFSLTAGGTHSGIYDGAGTMAFNGGSHEFVAPLSVTTPKLMFYGSISGVSPFTYGGELTLIAGNVYLSQLNTTGPVNVTGIVNFWAGATWNNSGNVNFAAGVLGFSGAGTTLNNLPDGIFNILTPDIASNGVAIAGDGVINNHGAFIASAAGNSGIGISFENFGTVTINGNPFIFYNYIQHSGEIQLVNSHVSSTHALSIQGGTLAGVGSITANVDMSGRISVGNPVGALTINGNLTFQEGSDLFLEFQGQIGGTAFDQLTVNGNVSLNGDLLGNIISNPSLISSSGVFFTLNANSIAGEFDNLKSGNTLVTLDGFGSFKVNYGAGSSFDSNKLVLTNFNNEGGTLPSDLKLFSSDIFFTPVNPAPGSLFSINASVKNNGQSTANAVKVKFLVYQPSPVNDFVSIGEAIIPAIGVGQSVLASVQTSFPLNSFRLIKVIVDPDDTILELKENNNQASQILQVGHPDAASALLRVFSSAVVSCQGNSVNINGQAYYDFDTLPLDKDFPVEGGKVTVSLKSHSNGHILGTYIGALTDVSGNFNQNVMVPNADGVYDLHIEVTDFTLTGSTPQTLTLTVNGACPLPPTPPEPCTNDCQVNPSAPPQVQDVFVNSEGTSFSNNNPELGENIDINALINYQGTSPVSRIPVTINDLYPVAGQMQSFKISESLVDFQDAEAGSPSRLTIPWSNTAEGAHLIQVQATPGFYQPTNNDQSTRLIFVGNPVDVTIEKSSILLNDTNNNHVANPREILRYTIIYKNNRAADLTGAFIIDDYDEQKVAPFNVSNGGVINNGTIRWNIGSVSAPGIGQVSYDTVINPTDKDTLITNAVFLKTDQTPTVGDVEHVYVSVNANNPPACNAGGNRIISFNAQSQTVINGAVSDSDHNTLTYQWFEQTDSDRELFSGQVDQYGNAFLNLGVLTTIFGVGEHTLVLKASDGVLSCSENMILTIGNSPPVVNAADGSYQLGEDVVLRGQISDLDGDQVDYSWTEGMTEYIHGNIQTPSDGSPVALNNFTIHGGLSLGRHEIVLAATDGVNAALAKTIIVNVTDSQKPTLSPVATPLILWPPNHQMVNVVIKANAQDNSGTVSLSAEVFSSEPPESTGDGHTIPDFTVPVIDQVHGIISLQLRAERKGKGDGRSYTVKITATDSSGNKTVAIVTIQAPHDKGK
jgi:hypothetical protein